MNAEQFADLAKQIKVGKKLPDAIYFHKEAFKDTPPILVNVINNIAKALKIDDDEWNLVKVFKNEFRISLLNYPNFFEDSYPCLTKSVNIDLAKLKHRVTDYSEADNPPILHRKETMIPEDHESFETFKMITEEGETAGLYENSRMIGFKNSWDRLIARNGYELVDGRLFRSSAVQVESDDKEIARHKTALVRHELSAPMKNLAKHGFLNGDYSIFDYGCGRGDDLRELEAHGLDAIGWDPNFRPDADKLVSDIVNIGYVINVIEDQDERIEAVHRAWELANKMLVVSAMLASESYLAQFTPYKDGVITSRNTFQKYFNQAELKAYIEGILDTEAIAISPGIYYIFKDKELEQHFLQNRNKRHYQWQHKTAPIPTSEENKRLLFTKNSELLESFWLTCLAYGRCPANDEFSKTNEIAEIIGSNKKAFKLVCDWYDVNEFEASAKMRKEDLILYFALELFGKRKPYTQQPEDLKRDIKFFFDNYATAQNEAKELLFSIADVGKITEECLLANEYLPSSKLDYENEYPHALTFHKKFLDLLSPTLRVYTHAGLQLYGDLDDIQLIKIHITSGKLTLLGYTGFDDSPLPELTERVKIRMADQDVDFFDYINEAKRPLLLDKIEYIDNSFEDYKKQKAFNKRLLELLSNHQKNEPTTQSSFIHFLESIKYKTQGYKFFKM
ncbi:DNA phosphorothioation-associated putative methyltransferase [Pseudoalteromonas sp. L21]|uniref:DNA phosphorothioation-associated putative methyltransferase n=1 Tax=Pseudoalteromonas sp. L21 TaxID=1539746 RepID=UPI001F40FE68|nr:DNA phosphorothioation-associated putative methyltransferase [Pseudoalteromonas sp. L21]MCF7519381.1 DNA phosphorothioation-associated putative methyltransferase [Pseudoalteromonas sp. L21]